MHIVLEEITGISEQISGTSEYKIIKQISETQLKILSWSLFQSRLVVLASIKLLSRLARLS
jgi:hypothetical protein